MKLKIICPFTDKFDHVTAYKAGDVLTTEDIDRVNDLVARGLCVIESFDDESECPAVVAFNEQRYPLVDIKEALKGIDVPVAANAGAKGVTKVLSMLTEEQTTALSKALAKEE